ncbi:MAG TPA: hypothetical protein PLO41_25770, partial [Rubrivivax sp.]|nr:hypothetical protein [Rubrivivax sp.]
MAASLSEEIAGIAARLVVDEGMDYAQAKRKAVRTLGRPPRGAEMPSNEQVEDEVRSHLGLFHADTQPAELRALRELALRWMQRLADFRPHLTGAVWRGTATRLSAVHIDLYCDDPKAAEIALINLGIGYDVAGADGSSGPHYLSVAAPCAELGERVTLLLAVRDLDEQRGALKP